MIQTGTGAKSEEFNLSTRNRLGTREVEEVFPVPRPENGARAIASRTPVELAKQIADTARHHEETPQTSRLDGGQTMRQSNRSYCVYLDGIEPSAFLTPSSN